jgi:hypothetical protein
MIALQLGRTSHIALVFHQLLEVNLTAGQDEDVWKRKQSPFSKHRGFLIFRSKLEQIMKQETG